jgi:hypothetical protein
MAFPQGVDFRNTSGYVSDPTNCTYELGASNTDYPTTTPQGNNIGWETGFVAFNARDRDNTLDPRLAGCNFTNVAQATFRIDLPSSGSYTINLALGDDFSGWSEKLQVFDGTTSLFTVSGTNSAVSGWGGFDANGNSYTSATAWVSANPTAGGGTGGNSQSFSTTIARFQLGDGSNIATLAHIFIKSNGAVAAPIWGFDPDPTFVRPRRSAPRQADEFPIGLPFVTATPAQFGWNNPEQFAERRKHRPFQIDAPAEEWPVTVALTPTQTGWIVEAQFPNRRKWRGVWPDEPVFATLPTLTPTQQGFAWEPQFAQRRHHRPFQLDEPAEQWPVTVVATPGIMGWETPTFQFVRRRPQPAFQGDPDMIGVAPPVVVQAILQYIGPSWKRRRSRPEL